MLYIIGLNFYFVKSIIESVGYSYKVQILSTVVYWMCVVILVHWTTANESQQTNSLKAQVVWRFINILWFYNDVMYESFFPLQLVILSINFKIYVH